jgi:hypothetical protein
LQKGLKKNDPNPFGESSSFFRQEEGYESNVRSELKPYNRNIETNIWDSLYLVEW